MKVLRSAHNPLIQPKDVCPSLPGYEVIGVLNTGVARYKDEILLLMRVVERPLNTLEADYLVPIFDPVQQRLVTKAIPRNAPGHDFSDPRVIITPDGAYLTAISHLRLARSRDGVHFTVDEQPALCAENAYEAFGVEDPRITQIGETYYINYTAVSSRGVVTSLARTNDFITYERMGVIFHPDNKDAAIFPEKINGRYYALHRPSTSGFGRPEMWLAESPDLLCWGNHRHLAGLRQNGWEDGRMGASAVPFRTERGWLEIYHAASKVSRYCLFALLLDLEQPWKVLARGACPILEPEADYEKKGFFSNTVFSCGALQQDGMVTIYYGAADTCIARADISLEDIFSTLMPV
jgi:beta-1,2-mannobiose phosphorylase / 1,2-beta-oligomannan phosphorylase